ncbi:MAG TPA: hypothetical protein VLV17_03220 [Anaeromyxobacteraceae bacterium]|nr:hypothetical protein [Anaeromyxobacteraceae bacterium]
MISRILAGRPDSNGNARRVVPLLLFLALIALERVVLPSLGVPT